MHIHIHLERAATDAAAAEFISRVESKAAAAIVTIPPIGSYWTGQGGIYAGLDRGWAGTPDGHLIVATDPASIFINRAIGTKGTDVQGAKSERDGRANTVALAEAGSELCRDILGLEIDGHRDFFLPARRQGALCYANVPELFDSGYWHWLSTQFSAGSAWSQTFSGGDQYHGDKSSEFRARACRRLVL